MVLSRTPLSSNLLRPLSTASSSHSLSRGLLRATYLPSSRGLATATEPYDLVVIGGGPGGYVAAIKAAQLGMKVGLPIRVTHMTPSNQAVLVDGVYREEGELGGNVSECRLHPLEIHVRYNHLLGNVTLSKWSVARLNNSQLYHQAKHDFKSRGIDVGDLKLNLPAMMAAKTNAVKSLTGGIETYLFKKNGIDYIKGAASFASPTQINVALNDGGETQVEAKNVIIATGSEVTPFPGIEIDEKRIVSSTGVLELKEVPKKMVIIGGGIIGLELGSVWSRLGSEVTVVEYLGAVGAGMDAEVGKQFQKILQKQGLKFKLNTKVLGAEQGNETIKLKVEAAKGGKEETLEADVVLVSIGRRPVTKNLGLENIGVETDKKGRIVIDDQFNTSAKGVKCIGDVTFGPMLAHKAEEEAIAAVEIIKSGHGHVNYDAIPSVVYTHPEVAWVGKNEEELKAAGVKYKIGKYPFAANSRAKTNQDTDGFVKFIVEKDTDQVLGCHIIGPNAGEMIASAVLAMEYKASAEDIARTSHAHPTLSEAFKEAAMASYGQAINY